MHSEDEISGQEQLKARKNQGTHIPKYGPTPTFDLGISQDDPGEKAGPSKKTDKGRIRPKSKISKFYSMLSQLRVDGDTFDSKAEKLRLCGFGGVLRICNWNALSTTFVKWVVDNWEVTNGPQIRLSRTKVLRITEDDVHRVYHLPRGDRRIELLKCPEKSIEAFKKELGLENDNSRFVHVNVLEAKLKTIDNATTWVKCAILYTTYCLLCPVNSTNVDLRYAAVLEVIEQIPRYNWCRHVLEHTCKGINDKNKLNPTADFHFLLINYLERMGKKCRLLSGQFQSPSLAGWDESAEMLNLHAIEDMVGLSKGVAVGVTKERLSDESKPFIPFDPDNCPLHEIPRHTILCKNYVAAYTYCLEKMSLREQAAAAGDKEPEKKRKEPEQPTVVNLRSSKKKKTAEVTNENNKAKGNNAPTSAKGTKVAVEKKGKNVPPATNVKGKGLDKKAQGKKTPPPTNVKCTRSQNLHIQEDDEEMAPADRISNIKTKVAAEKQGKKVPPTTNMKGKGLAKKAQEENATVALGKKAPPPTNVKGKGLDKKAINDDQAQEEHTAVGLANTAQEGTFSKKSRVKHVATWRKRSPKRKKCKGQASSKSAKEGIKLAENEDNTTT